MDFTKLEKELSGLMQKDDKYWRENDAKFRAAKQMATYEEFENIVKASHLKPLEKSDHVQDMYRDGAKGNSLVNPVAGSRHDKHRKNKNGKEIERRLLN